jgi:hypothetical protein
MAQHSNAAAKRPSSEPGSRFDRIALGMSLLAALFLCFVAGAWIVLAQVFPYSHLAQAYEGGKALWAKETEYLDPYKTDFWKPAAGSDPLYLGPGGARLPGRNGRRGGARMAAAVQ